MTSVLLAAALTAHDPEALALIEGMTKTGAALRAYTMTLVKRELIAKKLEPEERFLVKWQRPQKIYLKEIAGPREGQEVLFVPGSNKGRIKVHKGTFPDITVNLDPRGRLAMGHAHHPVPDVSIPHFVELVAKNVARMREKGVGKIELVGREELFGVPTVKIEVTTPPTGKSPTLEKGQTLWDLADSSGQSMYVILHANELRGWTQADHAQPGDSVIIPDYYAARMTLWIDEKLDLPVQADLYDDEGRLYEHYEHHDLKIDVPLTDADFDPKNPAYDF
ncbi:MAG TPA: DUF1571 domain-containing protein [Candidatus Polarisedimenticolaceae bacterium]|nr:DUF1571 domain-containing protein [Candidatus Polarisedimenticolaceae bacterium]